MSVTTLFHAVRRATQQSLQGGLAILLLGLSGSVNTGPTGIWKMSRDGNEGGLNGGVAMIAYGKAMRYSPGVMEQVVENRLRWGHLDLAKSYKEYVALADCAWLGKLVWLELPNGRVSGPHLVADCGAANDQGYLARIGFAVDLSWSLAKELGVIDAPLQGVKVWPVDPRNFQWKFRPH